jgi:peptidoglycan/LPS O-acetylase OafA/YrhL
MPGGAALIALWRRPPGTLAFVDGLRAIAVLWVLVYHFTVPLLVDALPVEASFHLLGAPAGEVYAALLHRAPLQPVLAGNLGVDLFLVLTGFLVGRSLLREHAAAGRVRYGRFLLRRWLRIAPAYLVAVALYCVDPGQRAACAKWGWTNLLFVNNLFGPQISRRSCFGHGWSLALEMQFYAIAPLVVAAMRRAWPRPLAPRAATRVPLALAALSLGCLVAVVAQHAGERLYDWYPEALYDKLHTRAVPCFLGLAAASASSSASPQEQSSRARARSAVALIAVLAVAYLGAGDLADRFLPGSDPFEAGNLVRLLLGRAAFSAGAAYLVLRMARGAASPLRAFLSLRLWAPLASLSYAAYLVQFLILVPLWIVAAPVLRTAASPAGALGLIAAVFALALLLVFTLALAVHLLVEAPLMKLLPAASEPGVAR